MSSNVSGMAAQIRAASESETFDLGGQSISTIQTIIQDAFQKPFTHLDEKMIRITLITGAGKLGRQKYNEGTAKVVTSTLRTICNFQEDRGSSCIIECAGSYKLQHDTGKNLKTVVVFPKIKVTTTETTDLESNMKNLSTITTTDDDQEDGDGNTLLLQQLLSDTTKTSPIYKITTCPLNVFERNIVLKCPTWLQKKNCLHDHLDEIQNLWNDVNEKLINGRIPLTKQEEEFYEMPESIEEKRIFLKECMQKQVEVDQKLTMMERDLLRIQVSERLTKLESQLLLSSELPKKRIEKLQIMKEKAIQRRDLLENMIPHAPPKLSKEPEIAKLRKELIPLCKVDDTTSGRLLSLKESQMLARKEEIMSEIARLEEESRGWFEDDDAFQIRVNASRAVTEKLMKSSAKQQGGKGGGKAKGTTTKYVTPKANVWGKKTGSKSNSKPKPSGGNVFAAMMMDSDSD